MIISNLLCTTFFSYNFDLNKQPLDYFLAILKLSMLWDIERGRIYAIYGLGKRQDLDPCLKMYLAKKYDIDEWIAPTFRALIERNLDDYVAEDVDMVGSDVFLIIVQMVKHIN